MLLMAEFYVSPTITYRMSVHDLPALFHRSLHERGLSSSSKYGYKAN